MKLPCCVFASCLLTQHLEAEEKILPRQIQSIAFAEISSQISELSEDSQLRPAKALAALYEQRTDGIEVPIGFVDRLQIDRANKGELGIYGSERYLKLLDELAKKGSRGRAWGDAAFKVDQSDFLGCVAVGNSRVGYFASGIILRKNLVVTAAHIWKNKDFTPDSIWIGRTTSNAGIFLNPTSREKIIEEGISVKVSRILRHPEYKYNGKDFSDPLANDLMLLEISPDDASKVEIHSEIIDVTKIDLLGKDPFKVIRIVGFGNNEYREFDRNYYGFGVKRSVSIPFLWPPDPEINGRGYNQPEDLLPREFAASSKMDRSDVCKGDSGGPAYVADESGKFFLVGMTSRGLNYQCGHGAVYTFLPFYTDWINGAVGNEKWLPVITSGIDPSTN